MKDIFVGQIEELNQTADEYLEGLFSEDSGVVVGLSGELGAGKTAFVKEVAKNLGITEDVTSPTFLIQKNYSIDFNGFKTLVHIDAYRLESGEEMKSLKFEETLKNKENLILIEWPEKIESILPKDIRRIRFETIDETTRKLTFYDKNK